MIKSIGMQSHLARDGWNENGGIMEIMKRIPVCLVLVLLSVLGTTNIMAKDSTTSSISSDNRSIEEKLKDGCEITAYIKQEKGNCEMIVRIKYYHGVANSPKKIEQAVSVEMSKGCFYGYYTSTFSKDVMLSHDRVIYAKYKEKQKDYELWRWIPTVRRIKRYPPEKMKERFLDYFNFTYAEFFQMAEELVYRDKFELGGETIFVKKREFKEIPIDDVYPMQEEGPRF